MDGETIYSVYDRSGAKAESLPNVYILEGGINQWLHTYTDEQFIREHKITMREEDQLAYRFDAATGDRNPAAEPNEEKIELLDLEYEPKVIMELKRAPTSGGCG